jgi:glucose-6-phosphate 1-dehydrogenase
VVEKPLGEDAASARELDSQLGTLFEESQIYRIDHYLAKDPVQNILAFRFSNSLFELVWNRSMIDSIQITAAEELDVGRRAGYYDHFSSGPRAYTRFNGSYRERPRGYSELNP